MLVQDLEIRLLEEQTLNPIKPLSAIKDTSPSSAAEISNGKYINMLVSVPS